MDAPRPSTSPVAISLSKRAADTCRASCYSFAVPSSTRRCGQHYIINCNVRSASQSGIRAKEDVLRWTISALDWSTSMSAPANANTADEVSWHAISVDEAAKRLTTGTGKGLDAAEATKRLQKYGPNRLPKGKKRGPLMRFLSQFNNVLVYVLLAAGFTKLMLDLWVDAAIILSVVILNALLGFIQEGKAEKALESISNMLSAEARTLRGGETRMIAAEQLVPGDIVLLESGDKIPADLRLVDTKNLRTEEAALT